MTQADLYQNDGTDGLPQLNRIEPNRDRYLISLEFTMRPGYVAGALLEIGTAVASFFPDVIGRSPGEIFFAGTAFSGLAGVVLDDVLGGQHTYNINLFRLKDRSEPVYEEGITLPIIYPVDIPNKAREHFLDGFRALQAIFHGEKGYSSVEIDDAFVKGPMDY